MPETLTSPSHPPFAGATIRRRDWPVATYTLIGVCVVVFLLETLAGGSENNQVLLNFGASSRPDFLRGEYWRLVMPMFLHIGVWHIAVNMLALYLLGPMLERVYGYGRYSLIYVLAGMGSSALSIMRTGDLAAGASGAIMGVAGAMLVTGFLHPAVVPHRWKRVFGRDLLIVLVAQMIFDYSVKWIDHWGHLGGLITGAVLALIIAPPSMESAGIYSLEERPSQAVVVIPIAIVALAMGATYQHYRTSLLVGKLLQQGASLQAAHQDDQARKVFEQAAKQAPENEQPREALGALDLAEKKFPDAIREYQQALRLNPTSLDAPFGLAEAYQESGDSAEAQAALRSVESQFPQTAEGQYALGALCYEHKFYSNAIAHYQNALKLKSDMAEATNDLAWLYATCDDPQYRDPHQALTLAQRAVELTGWKQPEFIDTLAEAFYANGEFRQAVETQKKALALDPGNREMQEHMAKYQKAARP
jgi:membrane associated rhomboid family serine protease/tetratricopeptide (TPR) repeat protein